MHEFQSVAEDWLEKVNHAIHEHVESVVEPAGPAENIFIVGAPRSGTTLLLQMIVAAFDIGYISNLAACFWKRPELGVLLSKKLLGRPNLSTESNYGQTVGPEQPHEFGGFWRRVLGYESMSQSERPEIVWELVEAELDRIAAAWDRPVVYKVFQLYWHLAEFHRRRPARWIWVQRDPVENAASLLRLMNLRNCGFTSAVPESVSEFDATERWQQATVQTLCLDRWLASQWEQIDDGSKMIVGLSDLRTNPQAQLNRIGQFLGMPAGQLELNSANVFRGSQNQDNAVLEKIRQYWETIS
ncbi:MAG: sulfotransferase [Planctomycetota bacterium]